ncbi:BamA/TamA family outer membrane protein [Colwellia sp. E2M01]|uniref:BamA/TamA family outer membrane protein n=1 Tax=Colwellia sp. E2M01 TaxID=2841561 RepID=UPI001C0A049F|nr:BamA/TamA family outer membrane protein [Colwellia sp. E2M01]MBU2871378.1 BamA/TamA family outer membrane protein [Colwellia sp. E2M01]
MISLVTWLFISLFFIAGSFPVLAKAPSSVKYSVERQENSKMRETLILPYAFSTDDLGAVAGVGGMVTGLYQKQMSVAATIYGGWETKGLGLDLRNYRVFDSERFFLSAIGMVGKFPLMRAYSPLPGEYSSAPTAGSNDSSFDDFIESSGTSNWWDLTLEYVVPWGDAKNKSMASYNLVGGVLENNPQRPDWNPLKTGTSLLVARQFNRYQLYENSQGELSGAVHALELGYYYDNTDFPANPSQGSSQYIAFTYNPQWLESKEQWSFIEIEASKYFSLGKTSFAKQNIIALNAWAGYSPSWNVEYDAQGNSKAINHAPFLEGATLGGMYRLRGFRQNRFHDKAVIYATAEYRMTLNYNPIADVSWLKFLNLDWFQTVFYVEGGRVSPTFNRDVLFTDWKKDVGVSLRALAAGIVIRLDYTHSNEDNSAWLMVGHPF